MNYDNDLIEEIKEKEIFKNIEENIEITIPEKRIEVYLKKEKICFCPQKEELLINVIRSMIYLITQNQKDASN